MASDFDASKIKKAVMEMKKSNDRFNLNLAEELAAAAHFLESLLLAIHGGGAMTLEKVEEFFEEFKKQTMKKVRSGQFTVEEIMKKKEGRAFISPKDIFKERKEEIKSKTSTRKITVKIDLSTEKTEEEVLDEMRRQAGEEPPEEIKEHLRGMFRRMKAGLSPFEDDSETQTFAPDGKVVMGEDDKTIH